MKNTKNYLLKTFLILIIVSFVNIANSFAKSFQQHPQRNEKALVQKKHQRAKDKKKNPEKFKKDLQDFITKEANLTESEARAFFPVFFEMKEKLRNLEHQNRRAIRNAVENNANDYDCSLVLRGQALSNEKYARIERQYLDRMEIIVGASKLIKVLYADNIFGRRVLKQMTQKK